jgi:predicted lipid-binding transport protein (Tim44 family)
VHASAAARIGIVPRVQLLRRLAAFFFLAFGLLLWSEEADARLGRDAPIVDGERVIGLSEPALLAHQESSPCAAQPAYPAGSLGGLFSRPGLIGGFAAGFLGAGIFGLLFGHGVIGKLSGVPSVLGLLFQFALLVAFGWLIWGWWRADRAAAVAQLSPRELADAYRREREAVLPELGSDAKGKSEPNGKNSFADEAHLPL